ncbi:zinc finger protein 79 isoform X4 [Globicephala melas]|uniref:zinc finger protein 79 isoform X4 n=1 Tax=Globicephala melas TaxID=9731 RepID=UPI00293D5276|nr:zinc finger protein 79 isoform X5 [Globicephala melas]
MEEKSHLLQILPFPKRKAQKRKEWQVVSSQLGPNWAVLHAGKVCLFSTQNIQVVAYVLALLLYCVMSEDPHLSTV